MSHMLIDNSYCLNPTLLFSVFGFSFDFLSGYVLFIDDPEKSQSASLGIWIAVSVMTGIYHLIYCVGIGYDLHKQLGVPVFTVPDLEETCSDVEGQ